MKIATASWLEGILEGIFAASAAGALGWRFDWLFVVIAGVMMVGAWVNTTRARR